MNPLVLLVKEAVETFVKEGRVISPSDDLSAAPGEPRLWREEFSRGEFAELLKQKSGTFVTIMKNGKLRGCIGTYLATKENIVKEVISNTIAAATEDYRFGPIKKEELPHLSYVVYILNEPELVKDISELNPQKYGIIIKTTPITHPNTSVVFNGHLPYKSGLLLPDLEGVDTVEKQISLACQKGGINALEEKVLIYKFTVKKFK